MEESTIQHFAYQRARIWRAAMAGKAAAMTLPEIELEVMNAALEALSPLMKARY